MRLLFCKIQCPPFICFCKPSHHICTPGPLKLDNSPHLPSKVETVPGESVEKISSKTIQKNCLKSSLRKRNSGLGSDSGARDGEQSKRVQWMDFLGKELAEIREFEPSEIGSINDEDENTRDCVCIIL